MTPHAMIPPRFRNWWRYPELKATAGFTGTARICGPAAINEAQSASAQEWRPDNRTRLDGGQRAGDEVDRGVGSEREARVGETAERRFVDEHDLCASRQRRVDDVEQRLDVRPDRAHCDLERLVLRYSRADQCDPERDGADHLPLDGGGPARRLVEEVAEAAERVVLDVGADRVDRIDPAHVDRDAPVLADGDPVDADDGLCDHPLRGRPAGQRRDGGQRHRAEGEASGLVPVTMRQAADAGRQTVRQLQRAHRSSFRIPLRPHHPFGDINVMRPAVIVAGTSHGRRTESRLAPVPDDTPQVAGGWTDGYGARPRRYPGLR
jgi:hypothetical protein